MKEANGKPAFNIAIVDDRTQEKHLEVSLRHAQKLEAVGRLAAGIAHEINTPIQFVGDNLTFLQSAISNAFAAARRAIEMVPAERATDVAALIEGHDIDYLEKQAPEAIQQSLGGIEHIGNIVQAMKFMSHDQRPDDFTGIDLNTTLRNIVMVATPETKYVASVTLDLGDIAPIAGSATDLNQVFLNLIVNAAHAVGDVMKRTGVRGSIDVKTWMEGDEVIVAVSDTGTGIPHGVRDKIFDPFFTTKAVGRGTGQGLSIARKHHGTLTFETEVGVGTTFRVRLPCHPARRDAA